MKIVVVLLSICIAFSLKAANVLWNCVVQDYGAGSEIGINYEIEAFFMLDIVFYAQPAASAYKVVARGACLGASENLIVAKSGDIANEQTTRHLRPLDYYLHSYIDDGGDSGTYTHDVGKGENFYLMFVISDDIINFADPKYVYGWVNMGVGQNGELSILGSALDLDGGPMVVGGGSAIPEPSCVLLALLGGALLVLRRKNLCCLR